MWNSSSSCNTSTMCDSMKNVLKNFDPFEVLQPQKAEVVPKENLLVDLSDSDPEKKEANFEELNGSLLEKTTKSNFDLVDLFQNLFVTPQHVSKITGENSPSTFSVSQCSKENREWIKHFDSFDYQGDEKAVNVKEDLASIFTAVEDKIPNKPVLQLCKDDDIKEDELIDEVFAIKRIEKEILQSRTQMHDEKFINYIKTDNLSTVFENKSMCNTHNISLSNLTATKLSFEISSQKSLNSDDEKTITTVNKTSRIYPEPSKLLQNNHLIVQTVKLDKKKYPKLVEKDIDKIGYTKGPDLLEKSIVLPRIIERLKAREKALDDQRNVKRRLILGSHNTSNFVQIDNTKSVPSNVGRSPVPLNPIILTADCNKQRLIAWQRSKEFEKFVLGGK